MNEKDIISYACNHIHEKDEHGLITSLAIKDDAEHQSIYELLKKVAGSLSDYNTDKWLYIILLYIFNNREKYKDPFEEVEMVYADFDYPEEIESFVRYMSPKDYNPRQYSFEENIQRLYSF
ncbi:DUF2247 family protein [Saezia sanguinis]|uniref:DUF2247 family protein n=1 Tax=Saezia sanguinis TaxID=1965230 RepID=UPI003062DC94